jgi:hypothetical protein
VPNGQGRGGLTFVRQLGYLPDVPGGQVLIELGPVCASCANWMWLAGDVTTVLSLSARAAIAGVGDTLAVDKTISKKAAIAPVRCQTARFIRMNWFIAMAALN